MSKNSNKPSQSDGDTKTSEVERRRRLDERLDEALEESFPASDVPAVHEPRRPRE